MTLKSNKIYLFLFCFASIAFLNGCAYSFSGSSLTPDIKSIAIGTFPNNSGQGPSSLSQIVTNEFRLYYQQNSNLNVVSRNGDLELEGHIISYTVSPVAPQVQNGIDVAARNRLTITVQLKYTNNKDPKQNFDQAFSNFRDFPQSVSVNQIDEATIRSIIEQMLQEIFNKTVANW